MAQAGPISITSRRDMLTGALAALALPTATALADIAAAPDAAIFDLVAKAPEIRDRDDEAWTSFHAADEAMVEWKRLNPKPQMREYQAVPEIEVHRYLDAVLKFEPDDPHIASIPDPRADEKAALREFELARADWGNQKRAAEAGYRFQETKARAKATSAEIAKVRSELSRMPAQTFEGAAAKARLAGPYDDEDLAWSVIDDLINMTRGSA